MAFITANWNPLGDAFYRSVLHTPDSEHLGAQLISAGGPENRTPTGSEPAQFTEQPGHMTPLKVASGTEHTCPPGELLWTLCAAEGSIGDQPITVRFRIGCVPHAQTRKP
ncbi:hypothetical protein CHARACLAT_030387 [Characodon lateralis]|uniref:Uncharacterized protein n=1 Tax=Characodon lateralis TaxID=208331 RepID=A0ABU7E4U7_9TELE|nr:hypothetical protein [Characodon lateralis]